MSRRLYVLWVPVEVVMTLMGNWRHHQFVGLPWLQHCADSNGNKVDLPSDHEIVAATYCWERNAIGVRISHNSFPEVADGDMVPSLFYREVTIEVRNIVGPIGDDLPGPLIIEAGNAN